MLLANAEKDFPYAKPSTVSGGFVVLYNEPAGVSVFARASQAAAHAADPAFTVVRGRGAEAVIHAATNDRTDARIAYAEAWLRNVAVSIGLGFHPDTRAGSYSPPLEPGLASEYDAMLDRVFTLLPDPYEVAYSAWREAGLLEDEPAPAGP